MFSFKSSSKLEDDICFDEAIETFRTSDFSRFLLAMSFYVLF